MGKTPIHEEQGSLLEGFPTEVPVITSDEIPQTGAEVEVSFRALQLHRVLGHLAYLSQTANYQNIETNPWFQSKIARQHPHDYQQHVDERLEIRRRREEAAAVDFRKAFGVDPMVENGQMSPEAARQLADDFYTGSNHSGLNPDRQSFLGSYADKKNNKRRLAFRKILEKQNPELKK